MRADRLDRLERKRGEGRRNSELRSEIQDSEEDFHGAGNKQERELIKPEEGTRTES